MLTAPAIRLAISSPNSREPVEAPSTNSTGEPLSISACASGISGAVPYPPPTSTAGAGPAGIGNGVPSGPTTSSVSPTRRCMSQWVPLPCSATTNWIVPANVPPGVAL